MLAHSTYRLIVCQAEEPSDYIVLFTSETNRAQQINDGMVHRQILYGCVIEGAVVWTFNTAEFGEDVSETSETVGMGAG